MTRLAALAALAVGVAAGCGVTDDSSPRALAVTTSTTEPPTVPSSGPADTVLWLVRGDNLVPVARSVPDRKLVTAVEALLDSPDDRARANGLSSSIPTGTRLRGLDPLDDPLEVDLSRAFEDLVGPAKQQAIGQLVLTATGFPGISDMRFLVGGEPIQVASPTRGDTATVDDCDFASLLPTESAAGELGLPEQSVNLLRVRRAELTARCGPATTGG